MSFFYNLNEYNDSKSGKVQKVVRKRSGFRTKALNFAIIAVPNPWSGTQNSVSVTLNKMLGVRLIVVRLKFVFFFLSPYMKHTVQK